MRSKDQAVARTPAHSGVPRDDRCRALLFRRVALRHRQRPCSSLSPRRTRRIESHWTGEQRRSGVDAQVSLVTAGRCLRHVQAMDRRRASGHPHCTGGTRISPRAGDRWVLRPSRAAGRGFGDPGHRRRRLHHPRNPEIATRTHQLHPRDGVSHRADGRWWSTRGAGGAGGVAERIRNGGLRGDSHSAVHHLPARRSWRTART